MLGVAFAAINFTALRTNALSSFAPNSSSLIWKAVELRALIG